MHHLFHHMMERVVEVGGGGHRQGVAGGSRFEVHSVYFVTGRPPSQAQSGEVADHFAFHPFEYESGPRVVTVRGAAVGRVDAVSALGGHPDPHQPVGGPSPVAPQAARFPGGAVERFAGGRLPGTGSFPPPHFYDVRPLRVHRGNPVQPVAPHVHEPAPAGQISFQPVQHRLRPIFGVGVGHHRPVGAEQVGSFLMQIFVGDDVEFVSHRFQPVRLMQVGVEEHRPPVLAEGALQVAGPEVEDGLAGRHVADAGSVRMQVVEAPQFVVHQVMLVGVFGEFHFPPGRFQVFLQHRVGGQMFVPVGQESVGAHQQGDPGPGAAGAGAHEKRDVVFGGSGPQPEGVGPAGQFLRNRVLEVGFPSGVFQVVVVKVDGGVFFGGPLKVDFPSPPVAPGHGPGGQVDRRSVQLVGGDVGDAGGGEVPSEIPGGRQPVGDGPACEQQVDFFGGQNPVVDFRAVYFAVEMAGRVFFLAGPDQQGRFVDRRA